MDSVLLHNKLVMIPLPLKVDWNPLIKSYNNGTSRKVISLKRREITANKEVYYEFEVEGHELDSYTVKIIKNKYGARGSCHCHDFIYRKLPAFKQDGTKTWCKHLLGCYFSIEEVERLDPIVISP